MYAALACRSLETDLTAARVLLPWPTSTSIIPSLPSGNSIHSLPSPILLLKTSSLLQPRMASSSSSSSAEEGKVPRLKSCRQENTGGPQVLASSIRKSSPTFNGQISSPAWLTGRPSRQRKPSCRACGEHFPDNQPTQSRHQRRPSSRKPSPSSCESKAPTSRRPILPATKR